MAAKELRLLAIDDEPDICTLLSKAGENCGYAVRTTIHVNEFTELCVSFRPTLLVIDLHLEKIDGIELLRLLAKQHCKTPIILLSGYGEKVLAAALRLGEAYGLKMLATLPKPVKLSAFNDMLLQEKRHTLFTITEERLARGIVEKEMVLHYQPKVSLTTKKVTGVEALVRWHPKENATLIHPNEFIPLAEKTDLIQPLTFWIIGEAFRQQQDWQSQHIDLDIAINLSGKSLSNIKLTDEIACLAKEHATNPDKIIFELTETSVMQQPTVAMDILTRLRLKDFQLSLDDFGTGYSSLSELHRMPFNEMKIDRTFIMELFKGEHTQKLVRTIIDLGHNVGMHITAEGVEAQNAWDFLTENGCDIAQGFLIAHALPQEQLFLWLQENTEQLTWLPPFSKEPKYGTAV